MKNLKSYIRKLLIEAMKSPSWAAPRFAIFTDWDESLELGEREQYNFIMYNWQQAKREFDEYAEEEGNEWDYTIMDTAIYNNIKAVIRIRTSTKDECNNAWEVTRAAADDGLGPTLYDLVMSVSPRGLYGDRESVSADARTVYKFYANNRPDVEKQFLDPHGFAITEYEEDDCETHGQRIHHISQASTNIAKEWLDANIPELHELWKEELESVGYETHFNSGEDYYGRMMYFLKRIGKSEEVNGIDHASFDDFYSEEQWRNLFDYNKEEIDNPEFLNISYNIDRHTDEFYEMQDNHAAYLEHAVNNGPWANEDEADQHANGYLIDNAEELLGSYFRAHYN